MNAPGLFCNYPKIEEFRKTVSAMRKERQYEGKDADGKPIFSGEPVLRFKGTVKLHGTNAAIAYHCGKIWAQSRNRVLTAEQPDKYGFYDFVQARLEPLKALFEKIPNEENLPIYLFGEWAGQGVMKGVAISAVPPKFYIFDVLVAKIGAHGWLKADDVAPIAAPEVAVHNIHSFPTWTLVIDFAKPDESKVELERITAEVERQCPVAAAFGHAGVGEGVVWTAMRADGTVEKFKVKGEEHRVVSSNLGAAIVEMTRATNVAEFIRLTVTKARMLQAVDACDQDNGVTMEAFIEWMINDIVSEEGELMYHSNLCVGDVAGAIRSKCTAMWQHLMNAGEE
jgi:hypothetical protein